MHGVLVVEDDATIRRLVAMVLQRSGFRVETAADGLEAVLKIRDADYDVVVLDLMMPNLDGFQFLDSFADDPHRLKSVIVTSAASPSMIRDRLDRWPFRVVPKPFDIIELVDHVRSCIAHQ